MVKKQNEAENFRWRIIMKTTKVYDWPTRIFHWVFVALFLSAFFIGKTVDDESPTFAYHMLIGFVLAFAVGLRFIWGLFGSRYARFSHFPLKPSELVEYFSKFFSGDGKKHIGHNPASGWAAVIMMILAVGLAITGVGMTSGGNKEVAEEIHEVFATLLLIVAIAHVVGVILHSFRHRDRIALSIITGNKQSVEGENGITSTHALVGLCFVTLLGTFAFHLNQNYDTNTQNLKLFGNTLQLGESEKEEHWSAEKHGAANEQDEGEEDDD